MPDNNQEEPTQNEAQKSNHVEIITEAMEFQMPDTIPSGWNTFIYRNLSVQTHFFAIEKYPDGITLDDVKRLVIPYFDSGMKLINEGKSEEGFAEFRKLPDWFSELKMLGGGGLISPGLVTETMIYLKPGNYFIECYIKMNDGVFHSSMGMIREFVVSEFDSGNEELKADVIIEISSTEGIVFNDSIAPGRHVLSVFFKDQIVHENFAGHDINLVKLDDSASLEELESWMNWVDPKGLIDPSPTGITFIGGVNNMPAGSKGYFTVVMEPGNYVLISEVPNALSKNMLKTFTVAE